MIVVPAGWFLMGQDDGPRASRPQRRVYLDTYAIDRTEVTQAQFALLVLATDNQTGSQQTSASKPVVGVLWREADAYCRWAGKRLPTEAEWEKAARGTDGRRYPWGDVWDSMLANTSEGGPGELLPAGTYLAGASPYGLLDMAGNAAEWVADNFDPNYYGMAPDHNPPGPDRVMDHVLRGGSWASHRGHAQTFFRDSSHSARPNLRVGFRCAQDWPPIPAASSHR
jgi:formylglycine-generating enzyme required for sulfatase activity